MNSTNADYNKWRFLIAVAHADNRLTEEEIDFLQSRIKLETPQPMQDILIQEMNEDILNPKPAAEFLKKVADAEDKIDLLEMAYELVWIDGNMNESEQYMFDDILDVIRKDSSALTILKHHMNNWDTSDQTKKALKAYIQGKISSL